MEVPIRTYQRGVLGLCIGVMAVTVGFSVAPTAEAKGTITTKRVVRTSTTKRVRTKTAYQPSKGGRRPGNVKGVAKPVKVSLPPEAGDGGSSHDVIARAKELVGLRYRWGGTNPSTGFDCTGLIHYTYGDKAKSLPRSARGMFQAISKTNELHPGDILFFGRGYARHAALYIGEGKVVHASTPRSGVRIDTAATLAQSLGFMGVGQI